MLRLGIISEIGEGDNLGYARVSFDENGIVSGWLAMPSMSTKMTKHWVPVEVNAQVACLMDDNCEQGAIVLVLWSNNDLPPDWAGSDTMGVKFADGAEVFYNSKDHKLSVNAPDTELTIKCAKLNVEGDVSIIGATKINGETEIDGKAKITGDTEIDGNTKITGDTEIDGNTEVGGNVTATEVTAGIAVKINLTTHKHPTAGTGPPSTPIP